MSRKESIKRKIKALLAKTTENGATEHEALMAIGKAKELMDEYFICSDDLVDPFEGEKCIAIRTPICQSGYGLSFIYPKLCKLFDCEHVYDKKQVTFFGFEEDVKLCVYFYEFILNACFDAKSKYIKSVEYNELRSYYHGRTLLSSFVKGFIIGVCEKMETIYVQRKATMPEIYALVVSEKIDRVKFEYNKEFPSVRSVHSKLSIGSTYAHEEGYKRGLDVEIIQSLNESKIESILKLTT